MHIVLVEPEIPQNTGNIARTCALTGTALHLIKPLGFSLSDRYLKRAGLDYWDKVNIQVWDNLEVFLTAFAGYRLYLASTKTVKSHTDIAFGRDDVMIFGCETRGLPQEVLERFPDQTVRIPMLDLGRSLNLSNAVAVILYEALRQTGFPGML